MHYNSDYTDPRTYIDNYVNAHFVEDGDHRYLEINYAVPVNDVCNGYSEGTYETFRVCVDEEISIDKMCINAEELFYNFYNYGFVNFGDLLYEGDSVYFKNEEGDCYTIGYGYGDDDDDDDDDESEESYVNCEYELQSCECFEGIYNGKSINDVDNVDVYSNRINLQVNANDYTQYYNLYFYFIHDESGSKVQIEYFYSGGEGSSSYNQLFEITGADLDCCCKLESFVVDENDLYTYARSYIAENEGQYLSLDDFIYYFSSEGNFNFYDCDNNCFDFYATYDNDNESTTYGVEPCNEEACCKNDIAVEYIPLVEPDPMLESNVQILGAEAQENCFDQFFDFDYISCNGLNYIEFTWYYNYGTASDCFNFPINSDSILISIPDDLLEVSCECPIAQLIIPTESEHDYSQFFQDCCTLSDNNYYYIGYDFMDYLACDLAILVSECNENFVVTRDSNYNYNLVAIGENYIRTTTLTDENDFASYTFNNFANDYQYALETGDGLSLREAVILNNHYDEDVDTILLLPGIYYIDISEADEDDAFTGDFDILNNVSIVGGCDTVIDCSYKDRAFDVQNADLTLINLDIVNGVVAEEGASGGGVSVTAFSSDASLTLDNARISNSQAGEDGGGVYAFAEVEDGYTTYITLKHDSRITGNIADDDGGGIFAYGTEISLNDNSLIANNSAYSNGGGVATHRSSIQLNDKSNISGNSASNYGGGIWDDGSSNIRLAGSSAITQNYAQSYGGGIFGDNLTIISLLASATINDNESENAGGIYVQYGSLSLSDASSIVYNQATNDGGGVYTLYSTIGLSDDSLIGFNTAENFGGGILAYESDIILNDSSDISNNQALRGGGIYDFDNSTIDLPAGDSSTISFNFASVSGGGVFTNGTTIITDPDNRIDNNSPNDITPLVLDLNQDGQISLISVGDSQVLWDHKGDGNLLKTGWVGHDDGLLVYDKDGDGKVTDISEFMFTLYHPDAKTDMEGLKLAFDSNQDLVFDMNDDHYREFGVWQDINGDGKTDLGEYSTLIDRGIESISLVSDNNASIQDGNKIFGSSTYQTSDGNTYRVADVGLSVESKASLDINDVIEPQDSIALESTTSSSSTAPALSVAQADCEICLPPLPVAQMQEEPQPVFA